MAADWHTAYPMWTCTELTEAMLAMAPAHLPPVSRNDDPQVFAPIAPHRMRVALMTGCAQKALNTDINDATIRLLQRLGCEVVVAKGAGRFDRTLVKRIEKLLYIAEFKRRQAPPIIRLRGRAFGNGRQMPIAAQG